MHDNISKSKRFIAFKRASPRQFSFVSILCGRYIAEVGVLIFALVIGLGGTTAYATTLPPGKSAAFVPLIGISASPEPSSLPKGPGKVTFKYAVKNFLREVALTDVLVTDDKCGPIKFIEGDDNNDTKLDYSETWRYSCTTKLSETTQSIATAIGSANNLPAAHKAYSTVVVGSENSPPLVSIINITKVAYPLTLPIEGGDITFTYRVNNPGIVPLGDVSVTDDKCKSMSRKLGDTNGNDFLDITEVWTFTCTTHLTKTTTNTVSVGASANGLKAVGYSTLTVTVDTIASDHVPRFPAQPIPSFPETGVNPMVKISTWGVMFAILAALIAYIVVSRRRDNGKLYNASYRVGTLMLLAAFFALVVGAGSYLPMKQLSQLEKPTSVIADKLLGWKFPTPETNATAPIKASTSTPDKFFGWKFPVVKFPLAGSPPSKLAYSDIRDPGGLSQGLPVRLKIPVIGVNSVIEDALITPEGRMDVPIGSINVAWFALGPPPGEKGSAVIGGHYGIDNGVPYVFYNLNKVVVGDKIYVENDRSVCNVSLWRSMGDMSYQS